MSTFDLFYCLLCPCFEFSVVVCDVLIGRISYQVVDNLVEQGYAFYPLPLILSALLHADLIYKRCLPLSGHHDVASFE